MCLGSQLLAASLGADVFPGPQAEVGVLPVFLTEQGRADPVFGRLPPRFPALQWHADTFALPDGAVPLARSDAYPQQAFVFKRAYALQFHLEVDVALAAEWGEVPAYAQSLRDLLGEDGLARLLGAVRATRRRRCSWPASCSPAGWSTSSVSRDPPGDTQPLKLLHSLGGTRRQRFQGRGGGPQVG